MSNKGSVGIIFLVILLFLSFVIAGTGFMLLQNEKKLRGQVEERLQDLEIRYQVMEKNLQSAKDQAQELNMKKTATDEQVASLQKELQSEVEAREKSVSELNNLKKQVDDLSGVRDSLQKQLENSQAEVSRLNQSVSQLEQERNKLKEQMGQGGTSGVELGRIVVENPASGNASAPNNQPAAVKPPQSQTGSRNKTGTVSVVNKEYNFAVVNLGQNDGIKKGDLLSVTRNNQLLGDLTVEKVHEAMSAANFASPDMASRVKEGDTVEVKK